MVRLSGALAPAGGLRSTDREGQPLPLSRPRRRSTEGRQGHKRKRRTPQTPLDMPRCEQLPSVMLPRWGIARGAAKPAQAETSASGMIATGHRLWCGNRSKTSKNLKLTIDVGKVNPQIVTNASNVVEGRAVVATVGASVPGSGGDRRNCSQTLRRRSTSEECHAMPVLAAGGGAGAAAVPSFAPGARPPDKRPRMDGK